MRRFLLHVLPSGFHRIRHYGLFANANRAGNIALARRFLGVPDPAPSSGGGSDGTENCHEDAEWNACPCCSGRMIIIETFEPGCQPRLWPIPSIGLDSSCDHASRPRHAPHLSRGFFGFRNHVYSQQRNTGIERSGGMRHSARRSLMIRTSF